MFQSNEMLCTELIFFGIWVSDFTKEVNFAAFKKKMHVWTFVYCFGNETFQQKSRRSVLELLKYFSVRLVFD